LHPLRGEQRILKYLFKNQQMPVKIRLSRHGKKGKAFYHIVVADGRAPRDGKFIEKIGVYNPNTNPATIDLNVDKAFDWVQKGAQPTDTTRAILSYKGVLYRNHLQKGVTKGALTQEQADAKFATWNEQKAGKIESKRTGLATRSEEERKSRLAAEAKAKEAKAKAIEAKNTPAPAEEETSAPEEGAAGAAENQEQAEA
jgi:small subunit ribosomal protein S16